MRIGWFSTGRGEGSRGLLTAALQAIDEGRLDARIEFVFCNRDRGQHEGTDRFLDTVEARGIRLVTLSSQAFRRAHGRRPWAELREAFDRAAIEKLGGLSADVSVGAGYMLLAPLLCRHHTMINLHPALPDGPVGTWQHVTWELIDTRARESGVMVHVMIPEMDAGPVITCCRFPLSGPAFDAGWRSLGTRTSAGVKAQEGEDHPLFAAIRSEALARERPFLVETLRALSAGRIDLERPGASGPLDLTPEVDALLGATG